MRYEHHDCDLSRFGTYCTITDLCTREEGSGFVSVQVGGVAGGAVGEEAMLFVRVWPSEGRLSM